MIALHCSAEQLQVLLQNVRIVKVGMNEYNLDQNDHQGTLKDKEHFNLMRF